MLHFRNKPLPEVCEKYLIEFSAGRRQNTVSLYRSSLHHFNRFLLQVRINVSDFSPKYLDEFREDLERHGLRAATRKEHVTHIHHYLRWLETNKFLPVGFCKNIFPNYHEEQVRARHATLPELAEKFLEVLSTSCKKSTVSGYQACLRGFYKDHFKKGKKPYQIDRSDVEDLMLYLYNINMGANQRIGRLIQFRRYLDWLHDHGKLDIHPDHLISSKDFPKKEERLPRPFPVDVDLELQKRLFARTDIDSLGLLVMRRTGLRVGELRNLTIDCIIEDLNGNSFLKVPLGKLNNERIVPIDPRTMEVIEKIKLHHKHRPEVGGNTVYLISNPSGRRRSRNHFATILNEVTNGLAIPGKVTLHRLRHTYATSLLSAGLSITVLKNLMGHRDIRMTLLYAAVTQETIRDEYFAALSKIQTRYEVSSYPLKVPDHHTGMNRAFNDAQKYAKKIAAGRTDIEKLRLKRMYQRLMTLRQEFSDLLREPET